jgi:small subunit ribosomal protein S17
MADVTTGEDNAVTADVRAKRKVRDGIVVSSKMDKSAIVLVTMRVRHPRYNKTVQRSTRMYVDDPANDLNAGDRVRIQETRPISKLKRWRLVQVLERAR